MGNLGLIAPDDRAKRGLLQSARGLLQSARGLLQSARGLLQSARPNEAGG